ncbi:MAG: metal-dependent transcriptional regulator [Chloroflexota bacterium]
MTVESSEQPDSNLREYLTAAHEDYLKTIYILANRGSKVSNSTLSNQLGVTPASATNMVKKLAELKLVTHTPYQSIKLTDAGQKVALEVLRHHRLLELYLHQILNIPLEEVHAEADRLEHVISESFEDAIADALGNPTLDPHGDPIPTREGHVDPVQGTPLDQAQIGRVYRLIRVLIQEPERLAYLGTLDLLPNAIVTIIERAPFQGPLLLEVNNVHHAIAHEMATHLIVAPIE